MKTSQNNSPNIPDDVKETDRLEGQIEKISFVDQESGFTIARIKVQGKRGLVTVLGNMISPSIGEVISLTGVWVTHPKYGEQFKFECCHSPVSVSTEGIKNFLSLLEGIGPALAQKVVDHFGDETMDIFANQMHRLIKVHGIGKGKLKVIRKSWDEKREIRELMLFCQTNGIGAGVVHRIFKEFGSQSIAVIQANPYRLADEVYGIGFLTADRIAQKLGIAKDSPLRIEAGIIYVLNQLTNEGHVCYPQELLIDKSREILGVDRTIISDSLLKLEENRKIVSEDQELSGEMIRAVYLTGLYKSEIGIAKILKTIIATSGTTKSIQSGLATYWVQKRLSITLNKKQIAAVQNAIENEVIVITGGPGTGKTTIINAIIKIFRNFDYKIMLAAPTGRAAKRMSEASRFPAKTIHRLLNSDQMGHFQKNEQDQLKCDVLVIDEASMVDTRLMHHLLKALPAEAKLILVGDVNQLPAVGPGNVLKDIIASGAVPVIELNEIFRQSQGSSIIVNAHKINQGVVPVIKDGIQDADEFVFIEKEDADDVLGKILEAVKNSIPNWLKVDAVNDIQVLTPMHRGVVGTERLNNELQVLLNPKEKKLTRGNRSFRIDDKVMQIKNNYEKDVFNGDIGRISQIDLEEEEVTINFDEREVTYTFLELDEIMLAYAVTVHKSQGSEYPVIVMPLTTQHFVMLQRNLLYTAVTRGKRLVALIGSKKALAIAVKNARTQLRYSYLDKRLEC